MPAATDCSATQVGVQWEHQNGVVCEICLKFVGKRLLEGILGWPAERHGCAIMPNPYGWWLYGKAKQSMV